MNKQTRFILCAVLAVATAFVMLSSLNLSRLFLNRNSVQNRLNSTRKSWESISDRKETLQAQLNVFREDLKEKELSLKEDREKSTELKAETESLTMEIEQISGNKKDQD